MNRVAVARCADYEADKVAKAVREVLENSAFPDCAGKRILIKPNILSDSRPDAGITTNPTIVEALILECRKRGAAKIYVGDSPGLQTPFFRGEKCGIREVVDRTGAEWVDFTASTRGHRLSKREEVQLPTVLDDVDFTISAAKFKTHKLMYTTGAVKNMFGLMPGLTKSPTHLRHRSREAFALFLARLWKEAKCAYSLIDGVIGMEGDGPANGTLRHAGLVIGGADGFLCDLAEAVAMGHDPKDIPVLNAGKREGLSGLRPEYSLLTPDEFAHPDWRKIEVEKRTRLVSALLLPFLTRSRDRRAAAKRPAPRFNHDKCVRCGRCAGICPAKALELRAGKIAFDESKCVRCYCCGEVCPAAAVEVD